MKKIVLFILFLIIFRAFCSPLNRNFKIVKIIGDDQSDLIFSSISDAILTPCKDIIILDGKGNYIARYDWDGSYINQIGRKGRGAGDFWWPTSASILNDKLYILDRFNNRFVESDLDLNNLRYFKLPQNVSMPTSFNVIDKNKFIINNTSFSKLDAAKICVIEINGKVNTKVKNMFFNDTPIDLKPIKKDKRTVRRLGQLFRIVYGIDDSKNKLLITFHDPDNVMAFYIYSIKGDLIKKFTYQMDKKYHFPHHLYKDRKLSLASLKGKCTVDVDSVFYFNHNWYIFVAQYHYKRGDYEMTISNIKEYSEVKSFYLKFDENGKFIGKFITDPYFRCFHISKDGYVLGKHPDSEVQQLVIYKILK